MNKFKKILLGTLSVLTLGLFAVVGTRVNAATTTYSVLASEVAETADLEIKSGSSGDTKSLDSYKFSNFFTFKNTWGTHSGSRSYTNYLDSTETDDFEVSLKAGNARTVEMDITAGMGTGTVYVYAYGVNNTSLTIGNGTAQSFTKTTDPTVYTGTVDSTHNTIVAGKSCCINAIYVVFESQTPDVTVSVFQQEATNQKINNKAATYIRFIAIISNADDVKQSDFTFKIYRTDGSTTQYITRTVSIYSALNLNGETYTKTLPGESTPHAFDGNNGTEKYAVYVVGFTNETYEGYTVSAVFNYKGTDYPTSGYEF